MNQFMKKQSHNKGFSLVELIVTIAIMAVLVVYCLKSIPTGSLKENLELIAAVLLVAGLHLTKKNTVLSISVGTVFYMVLVHLI